jgi:hypothetical protein
MADAGENRRRISVERAARSVRELQRVRNRQRARNRRADHSLFRQRSATPKSRTFLLACRLVVYLGKSNRTSAHKLTSFPLRPQVCLTRSWAFGSCMDVAASTGMVVRGSSSTLLCPPSQTLEARQGTCSNAM